MPTTDPVLQAKIQKARDRYNQAKLRFETNKSRSNYFDQAYWLGHSHGLELAQERDDDDADSDVPKS